jgi:hypothetical protein
MQTIADRIYSGYERELITIQKIHVPMRGVSWCVSLFCFLMMRLPVFDIMYLAKTVGWVTYLKWWWREQCEPDMDIQASCDM